MLRTLGPSGLLRLATAVTLGLSLLAGCSAARPDQLAAAMEAGDGWSRCYPDSSAVLTVVCLQPSRPP
ncbi:MAG TPA: hypothetical protein VID28_08740 [Methylomirabilota bacterium]|jgi:hypothetical protein